MVLAERREAKLAELLRWGVGLEAELEAALEERAQLANSRVGGYELCALFPRVGCPKCAYSLCALDVCLAFLLSSSPILELEGTSYVPLSPELGVRSDPRLILDEIMRVCHLSLVEAVPLSTLVTTQNLFRFQLGPDSVFILAVAPIALLLLLTRILP
ncbi:unnamed protein product [Ilex paraguariensis]|uniref:Uncharacterized protein n=1 Tax=Ilex paraguariensis TaxID=185542 RepID=A0ABC8SW81_9AQUA